jgi:hypothetical protein
MNNEVLDPMAFFRLWYLRMMKHAILDLSSRIEPMDIEQNLSHGWFWIV